MISLLLAQLVMFDVHVDCFTYPPQTADGKTLSACVYSDVNDPDNVEVHICFEDRCELRGRTIDEKEHRQALKRKKRAR